jgi:hypothetical protein
VNQTLKEALREMEALPDAVQEELAQALPKMAVRKRINTKLAQAPRHPKSFPCTNPLSRPPYSPTPLLHTFNNKNSRSHGLMTSMKVSNSVRLIAA